MEAMQKIKCLTIEDSNFPDRFKNLQCPKNCTTSETCQIRKKPAAAVVGARMCSPYGRCQAFKYARTMASYGVQIISGMAAGIDAEGHKGALEGTLLLLQYWEAEWTCVIPSNRWLYQRILEKGGGIISEFPGLSACELGFPARNRIISGLSDAVLVVEAKEKSGSLITANFALEHGKWLCHSRSCDRGTEQRLQQTDLRWCRNRLQPGNHAYGMGKSGKKQTSKCGKKEVGACNGFGFGV